MLTGFFVIFLVWVACLTESLRRPLSHFWSVWFPVATWLMVCYLFATGIYLLNLGGSR